MLLSPLLVGYQLEKVLPTLYASTESDAASNPPARQPCWTPGGQPPINTVELIIYFSLNLYSL